MGRVTITVLQGADRGRVFRDLPTPITIGREEGNSIQLNDERVSRCHLKIQQDSDRIVLTDLDSTNGTKVNGQECQLRILRFGDVVAVGRSLVRIGSDAEIADRVASLQPNSSGERTVTRDVTAASESSSAFESELNQQPSQNSLALLGMVEPPQIPDNLTPGQAAQLCEILEYLQSRLQALIEQGKIDDPSGNVNLPLAGWQRLLDAQARLGTMVRKIADPEWPH
ncbi:FHA domain-containing protein [Planctomycetaceae bacterium SH139]